MQEAAYYAILSLLFVLIEKWRIDRIKNKKPNVNHTVSWLIGFAGYVILLFVFEIWGWKTLTFAFVCAGIRGTIYDPFLNLALRRPLAYQSPKSDNKSDGWEVRYLGHNFWVHRAFYLLIFVIAFILHNLIR